MEARSQQASIGSSWVLRQEASKNDREGAPKPPRQVMLFIVVSYFGMTIIPFVTGNPPWTPSKRCSAEPGRFPESASHARSSFPATEGVNPRPASDPAYDPYTVVRPSSEHFGSRKTSTERTWRPTGRLRRLFLTASTHSRHACFSEDPRASSAASSACPLTALPIIAPAVARFTGIEQQHRTSLRQIVNFRLLACPPAFMLFSRLAAFRWSIHALLSGDFGFGWIGERFDGSPGGFRALSVARCATVPSSAGSVRTHFSGCGFRYSSARSATHAP